MNLEIGDEVIYQEQGGNYSGIHEGDRGKVVGFEDGSPIVEWYGRNRTQQWRESSLVPLKLMEKALAHSAGESNG